ncbi:MAG TPA: hypothetical protein VMV18_07675, partial [bacterium]|nr:hypothetical protein [bacterium]
LAPGVDMSSPGFGESALMEAEQLLDGEVLSVMLEMGHSAAAVAAETHEAATEAVRTGHIVLVDEDGQLAAMLVPALREAAFVVHPVRGREAAIAKIDEAAAAGERPLVICDLLLNRDEGGMLGGLDVAQAAAAVSPRPPVVLLAETLSDDVRFRAESAHVASILERPLKSELKKDDSARSTFVAQLLVCVDEHRPHAEWRVQGGFSEWTTGEASIDEGWNIDELERRAEEVEDLPDFGIGDAASRRDALWRETMRELAHPLSPPEILLQILRFGAEVLARGVLFTPTAKGELRGFGQFGVELAPGVDPDDAVRQIRVPVRGHPGIDRALDEHLPVRWQPGDSPWEDHLVRALGGIAPREILVGPVFCQGRLAAIFYGDMLPSHDSIPDTTNLEVVLGQAGLALDRHELEERLKALEKITR